MHCFCTHTSQKLQRGLHRRPQPRESWQWRGGDGDRVDHDELTPHSVTCTPACLFLCSASRQSVLPRVDPTHCTWCSHALHHTLTSPHPLARTRCVLNTPFVVAALQSAVPPGELPAQVLPLSRPHVATGASPHPSFRPLPRPSISPATPTRHFRVCFSFVMCCFTPSHLPACTRAAPPPTRAPAARIESPV